MTGKFLSLWMEGMFCKRYHSRKVANTHMMSKHAVPVGSPLLYLIPEKIKQPRKKKAKLPQKKENQEEKKGKMPKQKEAKAESSESEADGTNFTVMSEDSAVDEAPAEEYTTVHEKSQYETTRNKRIQENTVMCNTLIDKLLEQPSNEENCTEQKEEQKEEQVMVKPSSPPLTKKAAKRTRKEVNYTEEVEEEEEEEEEEDEEADDEEEEEEEDEGEEEEVDEEDEEQEEEEEEKLGRAGKKVRKEPAEMGGSGLTRSRRCTIKKDERDMGSPLVK